MDSADRSSALAFLSRHSVTARSINFVQAASSTPPTPRTHPAVKNETQRNRNPRLTQLIQSQQSRARRHLFLAERAAFRIPRTPSAPPRIESVGVVGAGTMGAGIAIAFLFAGFKVTLVDAKQVRPQEGRATACLSSGINNRGRMCVPLFSACGFSRLGVHSSAACVQT